MVFFLFSTSVLVQCFMEMNMYKFGLRFSVVFSTSVLVWCFIAINMYKFGLWFFVG